MRNLALSLLLLGSAGCVHRTFFQPDARPPEAAARPLPPGVDSVRDVTAGRQYDRHGALYAVLVGRHHRRSWATPVTVPVFQLRPVGLAPLTPGKLGGGFNSTSLSLLAGNGQQYVLRTVDKDPIRATPAWLQGSFVVNLLRDNVSATHPYAALAVPPLAQAVGVLHTTPRIFYVRPDDPAFAPDSLRRFRGQLTLLEEKFSGSAAPVPGLGTVPVLNSRPAFARVYASPATRVDQPAWLRARLLDAWLGDWDRHEGQWSWAVLAKPAGTRLLPLPKDRDMVFYRLDDGGLGWLLGHLIQPHWTTFRPRFAQTKRLLENGHLLDVRALNELSRTQFQQAARAMQQALPDSVLNRALGRLPAPARALEGPRLLSALQARRAALPELAADFYQHLARRPLVGGTAGAERFVITRFADSTVVRVYAQGSAAPFFQRAFYPKETKVIQLDGLGGDDTFVVENAPSQPTKRPRLRLYGGPGNDAQPGPARGVQFFQESAPARRAYDKLPAE